MDKAVGPESDARAAESGAEHERRLLSPALIEAIEKTWPPGEDRTRIIQAHEASARAVQRLRDMTEGYKAADVQRSREEYYALKSRIDELEVRVMVLEAAQTRPTQRQRRHRARPAASRRRRA